MNYLSYFLVCMGGFFLVRAVIQINESDRMPLSSEAKAKPEESRRGIVQAYYRAGVYNCALILLRDFGVEARRIPETDDLLLLCIEENLKTDTSGNLQLPSVENNSLPK